MCDVLFSVAWECGDKDCKVQWHKSNYWIDTDGYTVDTYGDGDHESIEECDLPSMEEVDRSWRNYAAYVARTGTDPLQEYFVKHVVRVRERWHFRFNDSIVGPVLLGARRAGRSYSWRTLPDHVKRYLHIKDSPRIHDFESWQAFVDVVPRVRPKTWLVFSIEHDWPRNPAIVSRDLRRLARRRIKSK